MIGVEVWGTGGDIGFTRDGTHAELLLAPLAGVRPKPRNLTFEEAAAAGVNFVTAWIGLVEIAGFREGETVLVTGASGGVDPCSVASSARFSADNIVVLFLTWVPGGGYKC